MNELSKNQISFLQEQQKRKRHIMISKLCILFLFLGIWEVSANLGIIDSFFFSSPSRIIVLLIEMMVDGSIFHHIGITVLETLISFFLVVLISILAAMFLWSCPRIATILEPYLVVLNSLPKSALAPLLIVWLGTGMTTIIVAGISVAIFGSIINLYTAFIQVDNDKAKLIYTLGGKRFDVLKKLILPGSIPTILSTMKVNIGLSLVGVIIGEFLAARAGLGYLIIYSSQVFQLNTLILSILLLCALAMLLYQLLCFIEKKYTH